MAFSLIFLVVILVALSTAFVLHTEFPNLNGVLKFFVVPIAVGYAVMLILNTLLPMANSWGTSAMNYVEDKTVAAVGNMGYVEVFPPLLAVLLVFMILAYSGMAIGTRPRSNT